MSQNNTKATDDDPSPMEPVEQRLLTDGGEEEDPYKAMTWYLERDNCRKVKRWIKQMELNHEAVEDAQKWQVYTEIAKFAMEHEEQIVENIEASY